MTARLDPRLTFGTLVTGAANQLVLAAARAVAEGSRPPFNPLVIHGRTGLGKTHVLHAIGQRTLEVAPRASIRLVRWEELIRGWREAEATGRPGEFLAFFREVNLLLVDDADGLGIEEPGRGPVMGLLQERLTQHRATVLVMSCAPSELRIPDDTTERLLGAGLVVELQPPDSAMRWEILNRLSSESEGELSPAVLEEVAALPCDSVLELVGAGHRLLAFQSVSGIPLEPAQARVLVTGVLDSPVPEAGVVPVSIGPARPELPPRATPVVDLDEFGSFLSDVVASVSEQVDEWRARIADAIARWEAEGYRVARLETLLGQEMPGQPDMVLEGFEADVAELKRLEAGYVEALPGAAVPAAFRDPDRVAAAAEVLDQARTRELAGSLPAEQLRFAELAVGLANREAIEVARSLATAPAEVARPLLIMGGHGVGKTHLLHAIGNLLVEQDQRGVVCQSTHAFQAQLHAAAEAGQLAAWRHRHRWVTALLLDDIQLLSARPVVQEELVDLLDRLVAEGAPVALTSTVPLAELEGLSPQLLARLGGGQVVELAAPDREFRLALVRRLLGPTEGADDPALADYLAAQPADSVRAIHGLIQRLLRAAAEDDVKPSQALARQVLEAGSGGTRRPRAVRAGAVGPSLGSSRFREKLVDQWPVISDRLVEDFR